MTAPERFADSQIPLAPGGGGQEAMRYNDQKISLELVMGAIGRLVEYFEDLIARYNAAVDHRNVWKQSKVEPLSKLEAETASELKRRSSYA